MGGGDGEGVGAAQVGDVALHGSGFGQVAVLVEQHFHEVGAGVGAAPALRHEGIEGFGAGRMPEKRNEARVAGDVGDIGFGKLGDLGVGEEGFVHW